MPLNVELLEESFGQVKPRATEFSSSFYDNLFNDYPEAKPLFAHTDMTEQRKHLIKALVLVVENLRKPDVLSEALKGMGARHVKYGTLPQHYPMVVNTLLKTFESYLGADWTPEVKQAWTDAYVTVVSLMLEGSNYPDDVLRLNKAS